MKPVPQDTPVHRATFTELTPKQALELVESMRERRMRQHTLFEEAKRKKEELKLQKDKLRYDKLLEMLDKKGKTIDAALECCSKYLSELKVLQLIGE